MPTEQKTIRKLRAILSADVKGYSLLMADNEAQTIRTLKAYRQIMFDLIVQHSGRVIDSPGDNLLAEFGSAVDAVECAVDIQKRLKKENAQFAEDKKLQFRIGINIGDVVQDEDRIYGSGVNIAARIEGLADPGGICISWNAYDHIKDKLKLGYEYLGQHEVKNIKDPVRVYKVLSDPEDAGKLIGEEPKREKKKWILPVVIVAAIVVASLGWHFYQSTTKPDIEPASIEKMALPLPDKPSIAVLPFKNMSNDSGKEYLSDGITDQIITSLSKLPRLFVISRTSTFSYKNKPVKVQQISMELGVRYVLEGSFQQSGDKIRITTQLIDALTGRHLWAQRYDRKYEDIFALQDEIAMKVLTEIGVKLTAGEVMYSIDSKTPNLEAYEKMLEATTYLRAFNIEGNNKARRLAEEIIAIDPGYSYGYHIMAITKFMDLYFGKSKSPPKTLAQATELLKKAIDLDETNSTSYAILCHVLGLQRRYDEAVAVGQKAIELNPNSDIALMWLSTVLEWMGKSEKAIELSKRAMRLCPYPPAWYYMNLGHIYREAGRCEEAITEYKKGLHLSPKNLLILGGTAICYGLLGLEKESKAAAAEVMKLNPNYNIKSFFRSNYMRKDQEKVKRWADVLLKAGIPEG